MPVDCPEGLVCYTEEEHGAIERTLLAFKRIERWSRLAWIACKPEAE